MEVPYYIAELVSQYDCVIIPGLGGFVGSYLPAQIHPVYHTFQPPSKKILFNINLRQNDGLLASYIAQAETTTYNEALEKIARYVKSASDALRGRKSHIIQHIGRLYTGKEGNIQFDQELRSNHLPESYGLQPFFSAPVKRDPYQERIEKRFQNYREKELVRRALPKSLKWAAVLALPVSAAILLSIAGFEKLQSDSWSYADMLSSTVTRLSPFSTGESHTPAHSSTEGSGIPASLPAEQEVSLAPEAGDQGAVMPADQTISPVSSSFAVIVGAFQVEENAVRLVQQLNHNGIRARILDRTSGRLSRVAAGVFENKDDAVRLMNQMKTNGYPGAWLLEKSQ